jgi:glycosyltransferase involved in cell wall biosynthesis
MSDTGQTITDPAVEATSALPGLVSVVIPNYNHTYYLVSAIRSVLAQTYRSFEVVVVDDGSTENCRDAVEQFRSSVRYIRQENQGLAGARNTGIRQARGELVALLDADDEWEPTFLAKMTGLATIHADAAVLYCSAAAIDEDGQALPQEFGGPPVPPDAMYQTLLRANFLIPSTIMLRRSTALAAGLFDTAFKSAQGCEDWDLWLRLSANHQFVGTHARLVRYRLHSRSMSAHPRGMQQSALKVMQKQFGPDDGDGEAWPAAKRRAYGGLYRYLMLTSVQRLGDWQAGAVHFGQALRADPSIADDLALFYDLALGSQPAGYRGTATQLTLAANAEALLCMISDVVQRAGKTLGVRPSTLLGTALHALGLVAYNTGDYTLSRRFLARALYHRPVLARNRIVIGDLLKSFGRPLVRHASR